MGRGGAKWVVISSLLCSAVWEVKGCGDLAVGLGFGGKLYLHRGNAYVSGFYGAFFDLWKTSVDNSSMGWVLLGVLAVDKFWGGWWFPSLLGDYFSVGFLKDYPLPNPDFQGFSVVLSTPINADFSAVKKYDIILASRAATPTAVKIS